MQLAAVLESATLYLGNDSGPTHLSAAVGAPTIALFGPTNPATWSPRGENVTILEGDLNIPAEKRLDSLKQTDVIEVLNGVIEAPNTF